MVTGSRFYVLHDLRWLKDKKSDGGELMGPESEARSQKQRSEDAMRV